MKLILLGAPGAGKGTQSELLSEKLGIPSISTGNMLREAMANHTPLGEQIRKSMDEGSLISDEIIMHLIENRIARPDCEKGFILDGVPRTLSQAKGMETAGIRIDHVISLEVDDAKITERISGRRVCTQCGATYHIVNNPTRIEGICDLCGGETEIRKDDVPETVQHRLDVYHASTEVLKSYYAQRGLLRKVCGDQSIEDTQYDILKSIGVGQ
jgi:adenylate kinase